MEMTMSLRNYKLALFAMLPMVILIAGMNDAWAMSSDYYVGQYDKADKEITTLQQEVDNLEKQIKIASGTNAQTLEQEITQKEAKITSLYEELDHIQEQSMALFKVDPETEKKLYGIEKILIDRYLNEESSTYIGENPVLLVFADLEMKGIVVVFDIEKTNRNSVENKVPNIISEVIEIANDLPVKITYGKFEPIACNSRTSACIPRWGGISIAKAGAAASQSSTLGYKTKDYAGKLGFVVAGHAVTPGTLDLKVYQPGGSTSKVGGIGQKQNGQSAYCYNGTTCDYAFIKAEPLITVDAKIYTAPNTSISITYRQTDAFQPVGQIVKRSGLTSDVDSGAIYQNSPNLNYNMISMDSVGGDSGSPVYLDLGPSGAWLYGMVFGHVEISPGVWKTMYFPQDVIKSNLNLTE